MMKIKNIVLPLSVVVMATTLGSCNLYKKYETPTSTPVLEEYKQAIDAPVDSNALGNLKWQEVFTDPLLQSYIQRALDNNTDLQNAKLNIDIAEARLQGAKLSYLPAVSFGPNGSGSKVGNYDMNWVWQLPLTVSWQVDIFGQITNTKREANAAVLQTEAYKQAVQSQIIAAVATCYYTLVSLNNQLAIYNHNLDLWQETIQMMKDMKESGRYTEVAVVQSEANYYNVKATIPEIKLGIAQTNNSLSLLLNTKPQEWAVNGQSELALPGTLSEGIPMYYLASRPDVRASEMSLAQAYYATNVARSNFYPSLTLSASGGYGTLAAGTVVDPAKWFLQLAGQLTAPIFSRGQNIATLKAAKLQQEQALNNFQYSVLSAASEVSNALVNITAYREEQAAVEQAEKRMEQAVEYNKDLMNLSTTTYLEVISAQQSLLSSQIQLESVKLSNNTSVITLYQALGGGR